MIPRPSIPRQIILIALVATAPWVVLALDPSFTHASRLDPSVPFGSSYYLNGIGFVSPWLITEVPTTMNNVSLMDRLFLGRLFGLYATAFILVGVLWVALRLAARTLGFLRAASTTC
ncbi:MAG TPA: hypothetical protein VM166_09635 [Gemmatimonadaceae bacterium]|nr:hypothetical protein [Gemmatimonadaceae bacterium]